MSAAELHALAGGLPPVVPLAWNFVVPAFLGFLVGSTYVLAFGLAAAVVVWIGSSVLFALWLATGLYPFNRLALIGFAVGGALVLRAAWELAARWILRLAGRVAIADVRERDRGWAGSDAVLLGRLARVGAPVARGWVDRRAPGVVAAVPRAAVSRLSLFTRPPRGGPVSLAHVAWEEGELGIDLDRVGARALGPEAALVGRELPLAACFALLDRAEACGMGAAKLICSVLADGALEVTACTAMEPAPWTDVWLSGAGVDLSADPVAPLEQELTEAAWGWDRLLLGRRSPDDVRFLEHRPYVSFESSRGGARAPARCLSRAGPSVSALGVLVRDLVAIRPKPATGAPARLAGPAEAVRRSQRVCRDELAPMQAWSALALRSVRWIEGVVVDPERRAELLARIQAPEARVLASVAAEVEAIRERLGGVDLGSSRSWEAVEARLELAPDGAERRAALGGFLARHGHRGPGERTLAGARLSDGPALLAGVGGDDRTGPARSRASVQRVSVGPSPLAWLDPFEWWAGALARLGAFAVRRRVASRERATRALAALRSALLAHGEVLTASGSLAARDDVFWLTLPDWRGVLEDGADVRAEVARRRAAFEADAARPARAVVGGPSASSGSGATNPPVLRGIPTSGGVARGRAFAFDGERLAGDRRGEPTVLVLDDANPAFAARLSSAAALVCERGGLLSHLAIVARELGVPAVMGVPDAARVLATGAWIEVDGARGEVRVLDAPRVVRAPVAASPSPGSADQRARSPRS